MANQSADNTWARIRRAYIIHHASTRGSFAGREICKILGCSAAQHSADIQRIKSASPSALTYDTSAKRHRWTGTPADLARHAPPEFLTRFAQASLG